MITAEILVGADNQTGMVDRETLAAILDARHQGWTMRDGMGSWQGQREESVSVLIMDEQDRIEGTVRALITPLRQEAVAWRIVPDLHIVSA